MTRRPVIPILLLGLLLIAYGLPWLVGDGAGLTFSGFDLAEWTSLHPAVRGVEPVLLTTLLLRLPLACMALWIAFAASSSSRWLVAIAVVLLVLAQVPPLEFLTVARDDPNYRQQALLTGITLAGGLAGVFASPRLGTLGRWIGAAFALGGAIASFVGASQAFALMQQFNVPSALGLGLIATVAGFVVGALWTVLANPRSASKQKE